MIRYALVIFFLVVLTQGASLAQQMEICGEVSYTHLYNSPNGSGQAVFSMRFNSKTSYAEEQGVKPTAEQSKKTYDNSDGYNSGTLNIESGRNNLTPGFCYHTEDGFFFREIVHDQVLMVKETEQKWNWQLHSETKQYGSFLCQKATTRFRGRNYIAWFTTDIPVPHGPWKLNGLPGLILEVYDENRIYRIVASKVSVKKESTCPISVDQKLLDQALSIPDYLKEKRRLVEENFAKIAARFARPGEKPMQIDRNCEDCKKYTVELFEEEED